MVDKLNNLEITELQGKSCLELMSMALEIKLANRGNAVSLCSIINAKSGQCSEDCSFCAQSGHYRTDAPVYPLKEEKEIVEAAGDAYGVGATHFSIVTSGRGLAPRDIKMVARTITAIRAKYPIRVCASLGILSEADFVFLREAGLTRYHHNLETSEQFFSQIVTTHSFQERTETILAAKAAGLEVCAGGIFGLGESEKDRISMAIALRDLKVDSVPLNVLIPLAGTPLAGQSMIAVEDILRAIALYRIIMPGLPIRLAAGRESVLNDFLSSAFLAGADGMMIGGYLTERGRDPEKDIAFIDEIRKVWGKR